MKKKMIFFIGAFLWLLGLSFGIVLIRQYIIRGKDDIKLYALSATYELYFEIIWIHITVFVLFAYGYIKKDYLKSKLSPVLLLPYPLGVMFIGFLIYSKTDPLNVIIYSFLLWLYASLADYINKKLLTKKRQDK